MIFSIHLRFKQPLPDKVSLFWVNSQSCPHVYGKGTPVAPLVPGHLVDIAAESTDGKSCSLFCQSLVLAVSGSWLSHAVREWS